MWANRLVVAGLCLARLGQTSPSYPVISDQIMMTGPSIQIVSNYFNLLAQKVAALRATSTPPPPCDLSAVLYPYNPNPLPPPSANLSLYHVAVGRGIQKYTCANATATAKPTSVGALATLFNASCAAAAYPDVYDILPALALQFDLDASDTYLGPTELAVSGHHYFPSATTPTFDLGMLGFVSLDKVNVTAAPPSATVGRMGEPAVPWLKLVAHDNGTTNNITEVYRVLTAGGSAPATCEGMSAQFQVPYAAAYMFYVA